MIALVRISLWILFGFITAFLPIVVSNWSSLSEMAMSQWLFADGAVALILFALCADRFAILLGMLISADNKFRVYLGVMLASVIVWGTVSLSLGVQLLDEPLSGSIVCRNADGNSGLRQTALSRRPDALSKFFAVFRCRIEPQYTQYMYNYLSLSLFLLVACRGIEEYSNYREKIWLLTARRSKGNWS